MHIIRGHDQNGAVGAHGQRGAESFLRLLDADGDDHDLFGLARFLETDRFFDCDFVERVHRHFDIGEIDTASVRFDADLNVIVDHTFDRHEHLHWRGLP